jgi:hypothetical protein
MSTGVQIFPRLVVNPGVEQVKYLIQVSYVVKYKKPHLRLALACKGGGEDRR